MTAAQRTVWSGIYYGHSRARIPAVTKNGQAATSKINVEPVRIDSSAGTQTISALNAAKPIGKARGRCRHHQFGTLQCHGAGQQQRAHVIRCSRIQWQQQPTTTPGEGKGAGGGSHAAQNGEEITEPVARGVRNGPTGRVREQQIVQIDLGGITVVLARLLEIDPVRVNLHYL